MMLLKFGYSFLILFLAVVLLQCGSEQKAMLERYSINQQKLSDLLKDYKWDYAKEPNNIKKENIKSVYKLYFDYFLDSLLERNIDSMRVTVDSVIKKKSEITTHFHFDDIELKYTMKFPDSMNLSSRNFFLSLSNLVANKEMVINFIKLGGIRLGASGSNSTKKTLQIFAFPTKILL